MYRINSNAKKMSAKRSQNQLVFLISIQPSSLRGASANVYGGAEHGLVRFFYHHDSQTAKAFFIP